MDVLWRYSGTDHGIGDALQAQSRLCIVWRGNRTDPVYGSESVSVHAGHGTGILVCSYPAGEEDRG